MARNVVMALAKGLAVELAFNCRWCLEVPRRRHSTSTDTCSVSHFVWCVRARDCHHQRDVSPVHLFDRKLVKEKVRRDLLLDRSPWWDHRSEKVNRRHTDFKHRKKTRRLWIIDSLTNQSVKGELATARHVSPEGKVRKEILWRDFFSDPSQWWDNRAEKVNPKYPDFQHKIAHQGLWIIDNLNPPWVEAGLATMAPGLLQTHNFSWNVRLRRHLQAGQYKKTLNLFQEMQREGTMPDKFTFVPVLKACSNLKSLEEGKRVHERIIQIGCKTDSYVDNCLIDMYAKCGSIEDAWSVFHKMRRRDVVSWSAMIGAYVKFEQGLKALELFRNMRQEGVEPNGVTFVAVLNACASVGALENGRRVHEQIIGRRCEFDVYVASCLVDMYAKCGSIEDAWSVFNKMPLRDVVSWSAMIVGYVKCEQGLKALELFRNMQKEGVKPDAVTFVGVLNACASIAALEEGRSVHEQIIRRGCQSDTYVANCLVDMYAKCGSMENAWTVFNKMQQRDVVSWSAMIMGCVKSEQGLKALELFRRMGQEGVEPNIVTFVGVLNACASLAALEEGKRVHEQIIRKGCESSVYLATCLVDMYAKCGSIENAQNVFNDMPERDVVSWSVMIVGYVKVEQGQKALELFRKMQQEGVEPNTVTFVGVLNACASVAALEEGRRVHQQIIRRGCESDVYVANCLIDMYAKCGSIKDARGVFNKMQKRNVVSWNAMIWGYAMHGHSKNAIELFEAMDKEVIPINQITCICLLSACSHGGLVKEGLHYFNNMTRRYNVLPTREHYACMVDLLGRAGRLEEAEEMTTRMPMEGDSSSSPMWMSLLGACKIHGNIEIAERAAKKCWELDPENASAHVLLSNIYAAAGKLDRSAAIEMDRLKRKIWKEPCCTWIEVKTVVHSFVKDDTEHPQLLQIHTESVRLSVQMNEAGYIPLTRFLA